MVSNHYEMLENMKLSSQFVNQLADTQELYELEYDISDYDRQIIIKNAFSDLPQIELIRIMMDLYAIALEHHDTDYFEIESDDNGEHLIVQF